MTDVPQGVFEIRNASIDELDEVVDFVLSAYSEYAEYKPDERWYRYEDTVSKTHLRAHETLR